MLTQADFEDLARFRLAVRRYLAFAETGARSVGLTSQQHQALLAIKAQSYSMSTTVGELAEALLLKPNSAAELVDRLAANGMIVREIAPSDRRVVHVRLTSKAESLLAQLTARNLHELKLISPSLRTVFLRFNTLSDI